MNSLNFPDGMDQAHDDYLIRWMLSGKHLTEMTCPHCDQTYPVPLLPDTDTKDARCISILSVEDES